MRYNIDDEFIGVILLSVLPSEYGLVIMLRENSVIKIFSDMIKT